MKSKIYMEKMPHKSGIYMIYSKKSNSIYIGKAKDLFSRSYQHIKALFLGKDNTILNSDFFNKPDDFYILKLEYVEETSLSIMEDIYYEAAKECINDDLFFRLYNINKPISAIKINISDEKIKIASNIIKNKIKNLNSIADYSIFTEKNFKARDWLDSNIISDLSLESVSLKEMFERGELEFLSFAKIGDYIGEDAPQTLSEILIEKHQDLNGDSHKCLWMIEGVALHYFNRYINTFKTKYGNNKKLYCLFKLTAQPYEDNDRKRKTYSYKTDGITLYGTGPGDTEKTIFKQKKGLLIKKFYTVKEDFNFEELQHKYYRTNIICNSNNKIQENSDSMGKNSFFTFINKKLLFEEKNADIRKLVRLENENEIIESIRKSSKNPNVFPECNKEEHPTFYLLAEIENYVQAKADEFKILSWNINDFGGTKYHLAETRKGKWIDWEKWSNIKKSQTIKKIKAYIKNVNPTILIFQEFEVNATKDSSEFIEWMKQMGYIFEREESTKKLSMTVMFIKTDLKYEKVETGHYLNARAFAIRFNYKHKNYVLYGTHVPLNSQYRKNVREDYWKEIINFYERLKEHNEENIIMLGDFNTSDKSSEAYKLYQNLISEKHAVDLWLHLNNPDNTSTEKKYRNRLDYAIVSPNILEENITMEIDQDIMDEDEASDHAPLLVKI